MADRGLIANGTKIGYRVTDSPLGAWTGLGQILSIGGVGFSRDPVDSTIHSTNIFMRSLPGMAKVKPIQITTLANPDPATGAGVAQSALKDLLLAGTTMSWRVEVPVDRAQTNFIGYEFDAYVQDWEVPSLNPTDRIEFNFTLEFDGTSFDEDAAAGASEIS